MFSLRWLLIYVFSFVLSYHRIIWIIFNYATCWHKNWIFEHEHEGAGVCLLLFRYPVYFFNRWRLHTSPARVDNESTTRVFPTRDLAMQVFQFVLVPVFHSCLIYQVPCFSPRPWLALPLERSSDFLLFICVLCVPQLSYLSGSLLSSLQIGWRSYEGHQQYAEWFLFWAGFHVRLSINLYFINNMMKRIVKIS